ncbi:hypothetical protein C789_1181 [Microcystis aeruginosa FACHB-905 = DIANCHI905]|nr:hypothetical protein C789_1181 [Microcystis aeruginosa FACHB-905 = DIANCHI905]
MINSQVMNCFPLLPTPYTLHPTPHSPRLGDRTRKGKSFF